MIVRAKSAERIGRDVETLGGPDYTSTSEAIRRHAWTQGYLNAEAYFIRELEAIGFDVERDPVGNLVARNRPKGEKVFGVGSHFDSNRNGGKWDGTLGVVVALEVCRLNEELGLGLPLQLISFLEEEGSAFNVGLLGSRVMTDRITDEELRSLQAVDDGRGFFELAEEQGLEPVRWRESARVLDDMTGWIELHIEQARVLQDTGSRLAVVTAISGIRWADAVLRGRADHAGATPMDFRVDPVPAAAEVILEVERAAQAAGPGTVGTVGQVEVQPNLVNVVPGNARITLDVRSVSDEAGEGVVEAFLAKAKEAAERRGGSAETARRLNVPVTPMDERVVAALEEAANEVGEPFKVFPSGAAHDTMNVAARVPSAMVFVPCKDGISHSPQEDANPEDAAVAVEVYLRAIQSLV